MWTRAVALVGWAANGSASSGTDQLTVVIGGIIGSFLGAVALVVVALINRPSRTAPSPPSPDANAIEPAEVRRRLDDGDEARDLQDRRLERHERTMDRYSDRQERVESFLDDKFPGWRRGS